MQRTKQVQRSSLKKGVSAEENRRRREETSNEIRKQKKDDVLQKRRFMGDLSASSTESANQPTSTSTANLQYDPRFLACVNSDDTNAQLEGTTHFRKLLSIERNPPIDLVIKLGLVPRFIQFLVYGQHTKLKFESAWALTNIASGTSDQTATLVQLGGIPVFVNLLKDSDVELREQAVWALGNIAGDSARMRDLVLQNGVLPPLLTILNNAQERPSMLRNAAWTLSNLCRGKPQPNFALVGSQETLNILARLIHHPDQEVLIDALWALSYLSDGSESQIDAVLNSGIVGRVVSLLDHQSYQVQTPSLRVLGNIVTGNDKQTQIVIDAGLLAPLYKLLHAQRKSLRKESAWTISNITAGNREQTQQIINANLLPPLVNLLSTADFDVKKEAAWALSNATTWKSSDQIRYLVMQCGICKPLCDLLLSHDVKLVMIVLEALENILQVGQTWVKGGGLNPFLAPIEEAEGIDRLEELQEHQNEDVYHKALKLIETYFGTEEEDENIAPAVNNAAPGNSQPNFVPTFNFGSNLNVPMGGFAF